MTDPTPDTTADSSPAPEPAAPPTALEAGLTALVHAGVTVPPGTDMAAYVNEHVAYSADGTAHVIGHSPAAADSAPKAQRGLPPHIARAVTTPGAAPDLIATFDERRMMRDPAYRQELRDYIEEHVDPAELRKGLMERTEKLWDSGEFDNVREAPIKGDILA